MFNENLDQLFRMNKQLSGPVGEVGKSVAEMSRHVLEQNLEMMSAHFARVSDQLKRLSQVKKPEELINLQRDCMNEIISASVENIQKVAHLTAANVEECTRLCSSIREPLVKAAEKAADKATEKTHRFEKESVK